MERTKFLAPERCEFFTPRQNVHRRQKYIDWIHDWGISKTDVAGKRCRFCAGVRLLQDKPLPPTTVSRIESAISEAVEVYETFSPFRIEISDPEIFKSAVLHARFARASRKQLKQSEFFVRDPRNKERHFRELCLEIHL